MRTGAEEAPLLTISVENHPALTEKLISVPWK
jgi:hypothetical protein